MSVRDSFIGTDSATVPGNNLLGRAGPIGRRRRPGPYTNWMFSPNENVTLDNTYANGAFSGYQLRPRLLYTDPVNKAQTPIYNFKTIGAPVSSNGTVYVLGIGYNAPQYGGQQRRARLYRNAGPARKRGCHYRHRPDRGNGNRLN